MTWLTQAWLGVLALLLVGSHGIVDSWHQTQHLNIRSEQAQALNDARLDQASCLLCSSLHGFSSASIPPPSLTFAPAPRPLDLETPELRRSSRLTGLPSARAPPASA